MVTDSIVEVSQLTHRYGQRTALDHVSFAVRPGEFFGLLGPNGGGKTTLFRILSTALKPQAGQVRVGAADVVTQRAAVRGQIGVVFQSPSLDKELTVGENLMHHGHLYGIRGATLKSRITTVLEQFDLRERQRDRVKTLSGGLRRRVELAKSLLPEPSILLLDEPSTGLDPRARRELTNHLRELTGHRKVTVLLTTHLLEEADECDRLLILDEGHRVALDTPAALKQQIGGDVITLESPDPGRLAGQIQEKYDLPGNVVNGKLCLSRARGAQFAAELVEAFPGQIRGIHVGQPSLEDVFVRLTGHAFERGEP